MTWDQNSKYHITISKKLFPFIIFSHLKIAPLILHRPTIRLLLFVREKGPPIVTFINLYMALHEVHGST